MSPWRPLVVFLFGLLHGLGFASVLGEFGLPAGAFIPALIGFNVGVEIGQLVVIAAVFILVFIALRVDRGEVREEPAYFGYLGTECCHAGDCISGMAVRRAGPVRGRHNSVRHGVCRVAGASVRCRLCGSMNWTAIADTWPFQPRF
ncbi:hypothetical protein GQR58_000455 [Nymphon striatum]|nr:hypothetical protein GQR58_000455 [Nymphon striatum]